ncbi:methyl-accepting chemotaxis protein [Halorhabdus rudnickae]|uniref:methyl-accepting chemotaxis protein n=1 Tax=Halorhabdus rudnickae TaxID=1775544 RepID=UPI0010824DAA|nr:extracellular solute-binding protein [Halorhabdus rudnickae]
MKQLLGLLAGNFKDEPGTTDGSEMTDGDIEMGKTPSSNFESGGNEIVTESVESFDLDGLSKTEVRAVITELHNERNIAQERVRNLEDRVEGLEAELREKDQRLHDYEGSVNELQGVVTANADGDLTRRAEIDSDIDTITDFVATYNEMIKRWNEIAQQLKTASQTVTDATKTVEDEIHAVSDKSEEIDTSVDDIARGAEEQSDKLGEVLDELESLSATIEEVAASTDEIATNASETIERGDSAQRAASDALAVLESMESQTDDLVTEIEGLNELMGGIEEVMEFITDIAEETNMLALNANIEAARADQSGDGFAVVADEIKSLATETKEATDDIAGSIEEVNEQTQTAVEKMHSTEDAVDDTREVVQTAITELDEVVEMSTEASQSIQETSEAIDQQASTTQEVVAMVDDVSAGSEETSAAAQTAAEATETQTKSITDIVTEVETLTAEADGLEGASEQFETGERVKRVVSKTDTEVDFWHAMGGQKALILTDLVREFEQEYGGVHFNLSSMGSYDGTLTEALAAAEEGDAPAITQVNEISTLKAYESGAFKPAGELLPAQTQHSLVDSVQEYYTIEGTLQSVPFNSSNPILVINKELFTQARLDPENPPETLSEVKRASEQLVSQGVAEFGITFANYSWFVEQWFAEDSQQLVDAENGRTGTPNEAYIDSKTGRELFDWWVTMEHDGLYQNPGVKARGTAKKEFHDERVAMLIGSTSSLNSIVRRADFAVETAPLPVLNERNGVVVGGASLWVGDGLANETESVVRAFFDWLLEPEQQAQWHQETGYFPVTTDAIRQLQTSGWFEENPHFVTAFTQLQDTIDSAATNGALIQSFPEVRSLIEEYRAEMATPATVSRQLQELNSEIETRLGYQTDR